MKTQAMEERIQVIAIDSEKLNKNFLAQKLEAQFDPNTLTEITRFATKKNEQKFYIQLAEDRRHFCNCLENYPDGIIGISEADRSLKQSVKKLKSTKDEISDIIVEIEELAATNEESYEILKINKKSLQEKQKLAEVKLGELKVIQEKREKNAELIGENCSNGISIDKHRADQQNKLTTLDQAIKTCHAAIEKVKLDIERLSQATSQLELQKHRNADFLCKMRREQDSCLSKQSQVFREESQILEFLEKMDRVKAQMIDGKKIKLEFMETVQGSSGDRIKVTDAARMTAVIQLTPDDDGLLKMTDVKVHPSTIDAQHIISYGVKYSDMSFVVDCLQELAVSHLPLAAELAAVQESHAVDWITSENKLRIIVGKGGRIVCTVLVPPTYPTSKDLQLVGIRGIQESEVVFTQEMCTGKYLTELVKNLEETYGRP